MEQRKRRASPLRERLGMSERAERPATKDQGVDRGTAARILAFLFGFGGILLLATLLLPDPSQRQDELVVIAAVAMVISLGLIAGYDRLPLAVLRFAPFLGTVLVGLVVYYSDPAHSAAYAMYLTWVVVASSLFLESRLVLLQGGLAVVVYSVALTLEDPPFGAIELQIAMTAGTVVAIALVMSGISRYVRGVMDRLEDAAHTDPLTGLSNRRALDFAFTREIARARRTGAPLGVIIVDLDGFKVFNDQRGHQEGDRALERMGIVLIEKTRAIDLVARIGGEEFAMLVPDCDTAGGVALAERLRRAVEVEFGGDGGLTASGGVASFPVNGETPADLTAAADGALYEAKRRGRNRVVAAADHARDLRAVPNPGN